MSTKDAHLLGLIPLGLALAGGVALVVALRMRRRVTASRGWPTVRGRVISTDIVKWVRPQGGWAYAPAILYEYEVDGKPFGSNVVHTGLSATESSYRASSAAELYVERFPAGSEVTVWYDPADPANAVLEPGGGGGQAAILLAVAIGFLVIAVLFGGGIAIALMAGD
jgi:hypothetical protein